MTPLTQKPKKSWLFVTDIETTNQKNYEDDDFNLPDDQSEYNNFVLGGFLGWKDDQVFGITTNLHEWWANLVEKACKAKTKNINRLLCFAHNLTFEGKYIIKVLIETGLTQVEWTSRKLSNNTFCMLFESGFKTRILAMRVQHPNATVITMRCSYHLLGQLSLEKLGNMIGVPKGDYDHAQTIKYVNVDSLKKQNPDLFHYWKQDLFTTRSALQSSVLSELYTPPNIKNKDGLKKNLRAYQKLTCTSAVFDHLQANCQQDFNDYQHQTFKETDFNIGSISYHGGLSMKRVYNISKKQYWQHVYFKVKHFDIVSSYPWRMVCGIPVKRKYGYENNQKTPCFAGNCQHLLVIKIRRGILKDDMPTAFWHQGWFTNGKGINQESYAYHKNVFNTDVWQEIIIWQPEWKLVLATLKPGVEYEITNFYHFEIKKLVDMNAYIMKLFKEKQKYKKTDKVLADMRKIFINSLYGKMGTRDKTTIKKVSRAIIGKNNEGNIVWMDQQTKTTIPKTTPKFKNPLGETLYLKDVPEERIEARKDIFIASWVTSQARCAILRLILLNKTTWVYSDTDSVYCVGEINFGSQEKPGFDLGDWNYEGCYQGLKYLQPAKCYAYLDQNKIACKIAGGAKKEISVWLQGYVDQNHKFLCVLYNFNKKNIERTYHKETRTDVYGSIYFVDARAKINQDLSPEYLCICDQ